MKICNHEGCKYKQFGGGFCKSHQYLRPKNHKKVDGNNPNQLRRNKDTTGMWRRNKKPIRKVSAKQRSKNKIKAELSEKDRQLWAAIWEEREHVDFETGEPIYGEPLTLYFHHVLPKHNGPGGYPQFRFKKWNIVLVSSETHSKAENNIDLVPKIKTYRDKLLKNKLKDYETRKFSVDCL